MRITPKQIRQVQKREPFSFFCFLVPLSTFILGTSVKTRFSVENFPIACLMFGYEFVDCVNKGRFIVIYYFVFILQCSNLISYNCFNTETRLLKHIGNLR